MSPSPLAGQHAGLDRGAAGDAFHRVDPHLRLAPEQLLEKGAHRRHAGGAADEDHAVDVLRLRPGVMQRLLDRAAAALDHRAHHALQFGAGQLQFQMPGLAVCGAR